jgi:hypothetical protein
MITPASLAASASSIQTTETTPLLLWYPCELSNAAGRCIPFAFAGRSINPKDTDEGERNGP